MTKNPIQQDNTPEIEEMKKRLEDASKNKPAPNDYRLRVTRIWNGKVAQQGKQYVVIDFKKNNRKYTNNLLVEGSLTPEELTQIGELLREGLREKFKV